MNVCSCMLMLILHTNVDARVHTHAHTRTHVHTRAHTHIHTHTHARAHTRTRTHTCIHTHTHTNTRVHTRTHTHTRTHELCIYNAKQIQIIYIPLLHMCHMRKYALYGIFDYCFLKDNRVFVTLHAMAMYSHMLCFLSSCLMRDDIYIRTYTICDKQTWC